MDERSGQRDPHLEMTKNFPSTYKAFENIDVFQTDENYKALYDQLSNYGHPRPKTPGVSAGEHQFPGGTGKHGAERKGCTGRA